jgi:hypothetical protein
MVGILWWMAEIEKKIDAIFSVKIRPMPINRSGGR